MKKTSILYLSLLIYVLSCKNNPQQFEDAKQYRTDSFSLKGFYSAYGMCYIKPINDSVLISYDRFEKKLLYFQINTNQISTPYQKFSLNTKEQKASGFFKSDQGASFNFYDDESKTLYKYDDHMNLLFKHKVNYNPSYSFFIEPNNMGPFFTTGDTIIADILNSSFEQLNNYYDNGTAISEWVFNKDTFYCLNNYLDFPKNWKDYYSVDPQYSFANNSLYYIFPHLDSLFIRDRSTHETKAIWINNKSFKKPDRFDNSKLGKDDYWSSLTKYQLANFQYIRLMYNENTKHLILFFNIPTKSKKGELPGYDDQKTHALVLDQALKQLHYIKFEEVYFNASLFFTIPGKGIVMPIYKKDIHEKDTIAFHIYNL